LLDRPVSLGLGGAIGAAMIPVAFAYGGWQTASFVAGEMRDPRRDLSRGLVIGVIGVVTLYLAVNFVCLRVLGPDGKVKFVVFRRDLAGSAPDRIDVRVVARVVRALTFDAKGKANFVPVTDAWNIRNLSYEFRVRPLPGNPEMLMVQAENPDFVLAAGRYVLALRNQGYDFSVDGRVTDLSQCLERTDAANGAFYSDCQKQ